MSNCKYYKEQQQISYDNGETWENVVPSVYQKGELYEEDSEDCYLERWYAIPGAYLCKDGIKYQKELLEISSDGTTYKIKYPLVYRRGAVIEYNSEECNLKFWSSCCTIPCSNEFVLDREVCFGDINKVGDCVTAITYNLAREGTFHIDTLENVENEETYNEDYNYLGLGKNIKIIGDNVFYSNLSSETVNLTKFVLPDSINIIGTNCFNNAGGGPLEFHLPKNLIYIGNNSIGGNGMFLNNNSDIVLPPTVNYVGEYSLTVQKDKLICQAITPPVLEGFGFNAIRHILVPYQSLDLYESSEWAKYFIEPIPESINELYRWSYDKTECVGIDEWEFYCFEKSTDGGQTWVKTETSIPKNLVRMNCPDCGFVQHEDTLKYRVIYAGGGVITASTKYSNVITTNDDMCVNNAVAIDIGPGARHLGDGPASHPVDEQPVNPNYKIKRINSNIDGVANIPNNILSIDGVVINRPEVIDINTLNIPGSVANIGSFAFAGWSSLTSVTIENGVKTIGNCAFGGCSGLTSVNIPDSVASIEESAFSGCGLHSLTIGSGITYIGNNIMYEADEFTIYATTPPTIEFIPSSAIIYVPCESIDLYKEAYFGRNFFPIPNSPCSGGTRWVNDGYTCVINDKYQQIKEQISYDGGSTWIDTGAVSATTLIERNSEDCAAYFVRCIYTGETVEYDCDVASATSSAITSDLIDGTDLLSVEIGECAKNISGATFDNEYGDYSSLSSATIGNNVRIIGGLAFRKCNLETVDIGSGVVAFLSGAFSGNTHLTSITVRATTPPTLYNNAFAETNDCPIYVPAESVSAYKNRWWQFETRIRPISDYPSSGLTRWVNDGYTCVGYDRYQQEKEQISYDSGTTWIDTGVVSATTLIEANSEYCGYVPPTPSNYFVRCTYASGTVEYDCDAASATSSAITENLIDGENLNSIDVGECCTGISDSAFDNNGSYEFNSLTSVTIGNNVTTIGRFAFYDCTAIETIDIGSGITSIGSNMLHSGNSFVSLTVRATTPPTLEYQLGTNFPSNFRIYVPAESVNLYKSAPIWANYADKILAITID